MLASDCALDPAPNMTVWYRRLGATSLSFNDHLIARCIARTADCRVRAVPAGELVADTGIRIEQVQAALCRLERVNLVILMREPMAARVNVEDDERDTAGAR